VQCSVVGVHVKHYILDACSLCSWPMNSSS
jgi:hypothetical protein